MDTVDDVLSKQKRSNTVFLKGLFLVPYSLIYRYINGLFSVENSDDIIGFADDVAIVYQEKNWNALKKNAETGFELIKNWLDHKPLTVNLDITKFMPFTYKKSNNPSFQNIEVNILSEPYFIQLVEQFKYFGIYIDCHLRWGHHITYVIKKHRTKMYKVKYQKKLLDYEHLGKDIISCLGRKPFTLRDSGMGWGGVVKTHLKTLEIIQKRFLRIIS